MGSKQCREAATPPPTRNSDRISSRTKRTKNSSSTSYKIIIKTKSHTSKVSYTYCWPFLCKLSNGQAFPRQGFIEWGRENLEFHPPPPPPRKNLPSLDCYSHIQHNTLLCATCSSTHPQQKNPEESRRVFGPLGFKFLKLQPFWHWVFHFKDYISFPTWFTFMGVVTSSDCLG